VPPRRPVGRRPRRAHPRENGERGGEQDAGENGQGDSRGGRQSVRTVCNVCRPRSSWRGRQALRACCDRGPKTTVCCGKSGFGTRVGPEAGTLGTPVAPAIPRAAAVCATRRG